MRWITSRKRKWAASEEVVGCGIQRCVWRYEFDGEDATNSEFATWPSGGQDFLGMAIEFLSISDQVAVHVRTEIRRGRWSGLLPGKHQLAAELGVNNKTVEAALRRLEAEGLLVSRGAGRPRGINGNCGKTSRALRIAILPFDLGSDRNINYMVDLQHSLIEAGHSVFFTSRSQADLQFDLGRIARLVERTEADAWVVLAASRDVLEWFAARSTPAFALFGQREGLSLPSFGPNKAPACALATRSLIELGHQRIVLLCRGARRRGVPSLSVAAFLQELRTAGIRASEFNLPDWVETRVGFRKCLEALFQVTPPTAMIVDEASYFVAVLQFLAARGIRFPTDVSLVCTDDDPVFACCDPPIACITWNTALLRRRVVKWAANVSLGKPDKRGTSTPAVFIRGGSLGTARTC